MTTSEYNEKLINTMLFEMKNNIRNGAYGLIQREMAYNSNKIEGSRLSKEQTYNLFNTGTVYGNEVYVPKDIEEATGHFSMFNYMLSTINMPLSENMIKKFHKLLKQCVFEDIANGYNIGEYKSRPNMVGDTVTSLPSEVPTRMKSLLSVYNKCDKSLSTILAFHAAYECIHPFQDGNGRTGRIIMFRECLVNGALPFIVRDCNKAEYISALVSLQSEKDTTKFVEYARKEYDWLLSKVGQLLI